MILAETAGLDPVDIIVQLRSLHEKGLVNAGIDVINGKIAEDMMKLNVIEPLTVKKQVLKSATEAASAILKIDDVIAAAPPKKKEKKEEEKFSPE